MMKSKDARLPNRREFNGLCAAFGTLAAAPGAWALNAASDAAATGTGRTVTLPDGTVVPALGQGSAGLGKGRHPHAEEEEALRTGLSLGMTLIDTAEIYGSEELIGRGGDDERLVALACAVERVLGTPGEILGTAPLCRG